jgi:S1-C subfamily serine protease
MRGRRIGAVALLPLVLVAADRRSPAPALSPSTAVVRIEAIGCRRLPETGVGTIIDAQLVVTAAHILRGASEVLVDDAPARVVALDVRADLALLTADVGRGGHDRALRLSTDAPTGSVRMAVLRDGSVQFVALPAPRSTTIRFRDARAGTVVERRGLVLAGRVRAGDSGAPVLDARNDVIGVVFATSRSAAVSYAVGAGEAAAMVDGLGEGGARSAPTVTTGSC